MKVHAARLETSHDTSSSVDDTANDGKVADTKHHAGCREETECAVSAVNTEPEPSQTAAAAGEICGWSFRLDSPDGTDCRFT